MNQAERYRRMLEQDGATLELELGRGHLQEGKSFSEEALDDAAHELVTWLGTRIVRRWQATEEPPTYAHVRLTVEVG